MILSKRLLDEAAGAVLLRPPSASLHSSTPTPPLSNSSNRELEVHRPSSPVVPGPRNESRARQRAAVLFDRKEDHNHLRVFFSSIFNDNF
jgi:hypothetical protein